jgi:hypothetical protein
MSMDDDVTKEATARATEAREIMQSNDPAEPLLQWFGFAHLPPHLAKVSEPFGVLAAKLASEVPRNAERTVALRKLLEAKDAAVRAVLSK